MSSSKLHGQGRLYIAFALFTASIASAYLISLLGNRSESYWIVSRPVPIGVQLTTNDVTQGSALLKFGRNSYLHTNTDPVGSITKRALAAGEILSTDALSEDSSRLLTEELSISVRASDIPSRSTIGDMVALYQIHDRQNGDAPQEPELVVTGVFIADIDRKSANFGNNISLTLALSRNLIPRLLAATTSGRIVIVASHG